MDQQAFEIWVSLEYMCRCAYDLWDWSVRERNLHFKGLAHQYTAEERAAAVATTELSEALWRTWRQASYISQVLLDELDL